MLGWWKVSHRCQKDLTGVIRVKIKAEGAVGQRGVPCPNPLDNLDKSVILLWLLRGSFHAQIPISPSHLLVMCFIKESVSLTSNSSGSKRQILKALVPLRTHFFSLFLVLCHTNKGFPSKTSRSVHWSVVANISIPTFS